MRKNYETLIQEFKLGIRVNTRSVEANQHYVKPMYYEIPKNGKSFVDLKAENDLEPYYIIEKNLSRMGYNDELLTLYRDNGDSLLKAQAVFIPCISWAYIFAQSIGNAKVFAMNVEHDWLHYKDFCDNGLISIWKDAIEEKNTNYILVLEDLNITQPECGCAPLLDVINGYRPVLEGTNYNLPKNLKIFATLIPHWEENVGLKLSKRLFAKWRTFGDFTKNQFLYPVKTEQSSLYGYFEPDDLFALYNNTYSLGEPYFDRQQ